MNIKRTRFLLLILGFVAISVAITWLLDPSFSRKADAQIATQPSLVSGNQLRLVDAIGRDFGVLVDARMELNSYGQNSSYEWYTRNSYAAFLPQQGLFVRFEDIVGPGTTTGQVIVKWKAPSDTTYVKFVIRNFFFNSQNCSGSPYESQILTALPQYVLQYGARYFTYLSSATTTGVTFLSYLNYSGLCTNIAPDATTTPLYLIKEIPNPFPQPPISPLRVIQK